MPDVRRCNNHVCNRDIQCECLSGYQHITIQLFRISRWHASVTRLSPESGGEPQCHVGQDKVAISLRCVEGIQLCQSLPASGTLQFTSYLVVGNSRHHETMSCSHHVQCPAHDCPGLRGFLGIGQQAQWPCVEYDNATHG